jgi:hypothetical protein
LIGIKFIESRTFEENHHKYLKRTYPDNAFEFSIGNKKKIELYTFTKTLWDEFNKIDDYHQPDRHVELTEEDKSTQFDLDNQLETFCNNIVDSFDIDLYMKKKLDTDVCSQLCKVLLMAKHELRELQNFYKSPSEQLECIKNAQILADKQTNQAKEIRKVLKQQHIVIEAKIRKYQTKKEAKISIYKAKQDAEIEVQNTIIQEQKLIELKLKLIAAEKGELDDDTDNLPVCKRTGRKIHTLN